MPVRKTLSYLDPRQSISARIGLSTAALAVFLSVATGGLMGYSAMLSTEKAIGEALADMAYQMADKLDLGMFERYKEIQVMAEWPELRGTPVDAAAKRKILEGMKSRYPQHAWIGLTDTRGVVVAGTGGLLEGKDVSARPWFPGGSKGLYVGDVHGAVLLAKHLPAPPDGNLRFVDVAAPLHDSSGNFLGVLCSHLNWEWAREVRSTLLHEEEEKKGIELIVLGSRGELLLGPSSLAKADLGGLNSLLAGRKSRTYGVFLWPDGGQYLTGLARDEGHLDYPGLGWVILARQPLQRAYEPAHSLMRTMVFYGVASGVLLALLAWYIAHRLSVPLRHIARVADRIHQGSHEMSLAPAAGQDEVAVLTTSLSEMLGALRARNAELAAARDNLEAKVLERTRELQQANEALRNSEMHLSEAQKIGLVGSLEVDCANSAMFWSDQMYRMLGYEPGGVEHTMASLLGHVHPEDRASAEGYILSEATGDLEIRLRTASGVERHCLMRGTMTESGPGGACGARHITVLDITARKSEERLREEVDLIMRHDLKAPLNAIINFPELIRAEGNLTEEQAEFLGYIEQAGLTMMYQINESLNLYKMEAGTFRAEPAEVEMDRLVRRLMNTLAPMARDRGVAVEAAFEGNPLMPGQRTLALGDEHLYFSMLANIVKNALEASPQGGVVRVGMSSKGQWLLVEVHNAGVVPEGVRGVFFEKYTTCGKKGGTGLGNYSARRIAEAFGGSLEMRTSEAEGTTVSVKLRQPAGA